MDGVWSGACGGGRAGCQKRAGSGRRDLVEAVAMASPAAVGWPECTELLRFEPGAGRTFEHGFAEKVIPRYGLRALMAVSICRILSYRV